ncbi:MAG: DUF3667 domain-containing protein [Saprospiraceae bacterium]|nr:DUF3667 domain-containing protein [Saprospiraceae bacterium]
MESCKNCNTSFEGVFCPQCGQKIIQGRLNIKEATVEIFDLLTNVDKGIWFTIVQLLKNPGKVVQEYIQGKRKKYFAPFKLLLLSTTVSVVVETFITKRLLHQETQLPENANLLDRIFTDYASLGTLVLVPVLALAFFILFRKQRFNFTESLVFSAYIMSVINLFVLVIYSPMLLIAKGDLPSLLVAEFIIIILIWFGITTFQGKKWKVALKSVLALFLFILILAILVSLADFILS